MYSQFNEETYFLRSLAGIPVGRFLEIGAFNPTLYSNSRALYELGWSGVLVEPSPGPMSILLNAYGNDPRITLVQAAVTTGGGGYLVKLQASDDAFSTDVQANFDKWRATKQFRGSIQVPVISLEYLLARFLRFDFISIDTEGTSVDLFTEMIRLVSHEFARAPRCVVVEHDLRLGDLDRAAEIGGYRLLHENTTNRVYELAGEVVINAPPSKRPLGHS